MPVVPKTKEADKVGLPVYVSVRAISVLSEETLQSQGC